MPDQIIGACPALEGFRRHMPSLSREATPLIFTGESGVGKAFLAAHIHAAGLRKMVPANVLNFSILSERDQRMGLLGGEPPDLTSSRRSMLELDTTVILKHIDRAGFYLQDKLAESILTSTINRPGSSKPHRVSARMIFTFRDSLQVMKRNESLSPKLLEVLRPFKRIHLPPLHERKEDVPPLIRHFAKKFYDRFSRQGKISIRGIAKDGSIDGELLQLISSHRWKENVRDLVALVLSLTLFPFAKEILEVEKLEFAKMAMLVEEEQEFSLSARLSNVERRIISRAFQKMNKHKQNAAHLLGLSERSIGRKSGKHS